MASGRKLEQSKEAQEATEASAGVRGRGVGSWKRKEMIYSQVSIDGVCVCVNVNVTELNYFMNFRIIFQIKKDEGLLTEKRDEEHFQSS